MFPLQNAETVTQRGEDNCKSQIREDQGETVSSGEYETVYQELTAAVVAYTRPTQDEAGKHSGMEWGGIAEPVPLPEELWKCNGFLRKESPFVIRV